MKVEKLLSYYANLGEGLEVGSGPFGNRLIVEVDGGEFEGPGIKGTIRKAGCADWLAMDEEYGHLDVRATFVTDDDAVIYVQYNGHIELTPGIQAALGGEGETNMGDQYFFTTIRMQTGHEKYRYLNNLVCIGQGRLNNGRVEYDVYKAMN